MEANTSIQELMEKIIELEFKIAYQRKLLDAINIVGLTQNIKDFNLKAAREELIKKYPKYEGSITRFVYN